MEFNIYLTFDIKGKVLFLPPVVGSETEWNKLIKRLLA